MAELTWITEDCLIQNMPVGTKASVGANSGIVGGLVLTNAIAYNNPIEGPYVIERRQDGFYDAQGTRLRTPDEMDAMTTWSLYRITGRIKTKVGRRKPKEVAYLVVAPSEDFATRIGAFFADREGDETLRIDEPEFMDEAFEA